MSAPLRVGIVGLGKMGLLHGKTWQRLAGVQLVAVVDADPAKAAWAAAHGCAFFGQSRALVGLVDLAIIATPSSDHALSTLPLLEAGIHCLVEKPLALDFASCRQLVACAHQHQALLAVGHSERFNPAIHLARRALAGSACLAEIVRVVPRPAQHRSDSDVVQDLMVHDLDWLLDVLGKPHDDIRILEQRQYAGQLAHVRCELKFAAGTRVRLTACRDDAQQRRQVILHHPHAERQVIELGAAIPQGQPDALTRQAMALLQALRGEASSIALGQAALAVMNLGERIRQQCNTADALTS